MLRSHLVTAEVFYSIQGEGQTIGIPSVFLRLAGCNLLCEGAGWRCDTIEVWQKGTSKEFKDVINLEYVAFLQRGAHLVITGGEPLLQQERIVDYLNWFRQEHKFTPIVEVETNGTIIPSDIMIEKIDYWNCSPKLSTAGESYERRVNEVAISKILRAGKNVIFKFVISKEDDLFEITDDFSFIPSEKLMFMPAGASQEELQATAEMVADACKGFGIRYSTRLHIYIWNKKTGV